MLCPILREAHFVLKRLLIYAFSRCTSPSPLTWMNYPFPPKPEKDWMVVSLVWDNVCFQRLKTKAPNAILRQDNLDLGFKVINSIFGEMDKKNTSYLQEIIEHRERRKTKHQLSTQ